MTYVVRLRTFTLLFLLLACSRPAVSAGNSRTEPTPVVIVPGDGSSVLEARLRGKTSKHFYCARHSTWFRLWLNPPDLISPAINCWAENIQLVYDRETQRYHNPEGVETRTPGWGTLEGLNLDKSIPFGLSNPWEMLIRKLQGYGYVSGISLRAAPYDFRYAISRDYIQRLKDLIEQTVGLNGGRRVALVSHSMGCLYTLKFLNTMSASWKERFIQHWIPVSAVFGGSQDEIELFASGNNEGISFVTPLTIRAEQRSYESNFWLLPAPAVYKNRVVASTNQRNYTTQDYEAFFNDIRFEEGYEQWKRLAQYTSELQFPGVNVTHFYGTGVKTPRKMNWPDANFDKPPNVEYEHDGDGTVNGISLRAPNVLWARESFQVHELRRESHVEVLKSKKFLTKLVDILGAKRGVRALPESTII